MENTIHCSFNVAALKEPKGGYKLTQILIFALFFSNYVPFEWLDLSRQYVKIPYRLAKTLGKEGGPSSKGTNDGNPMGHIRGPSVKQNAA